MSPRSTEPVPLSRRQFLVRCGAAGALSAVAGSPHVSFAAAATAGRDDVAAALQRLSLDTIRGLVVLVVPGTDAYSRAQGLTHPRPGGIEARGAEGIIEVFDRFLPMPDGLARGMAAALATGMSEAPLPAARGLLRGAERGAARLDRAFESVLANDETVPLSALVGLMLNFVATSVDPRALTGRFPSAPFANLAFARKVEVFRRLEEEHPEIVALLDRGAPGPMRESFSGQIRYLGGALPAAACLYAYNEWGVLDPRHGVATTRPVGWDLTGYAPGRTQPADGWPELMGYYRDRREAEGGSRA